MAKKEKTIEQHVAEAVLQKQMTVTIGGRDFEVARPTIATLYDLSAIVSELADVEIGETSDNMQNIINATLQLAKYAPVQTEALAKLILGAKENGYVETKKATKKSSLLGLIGIRKTICETTKIDRFEELKTWLMYNGSPAEMQSAIVQILGTNAETPFFFQTTCFLKGTRMTAPTKTKTTTPGQ